MSEEFFKRLASFEGQPAAPAARGRDAVDEPMIRHWCEAMGDTNPVYTDPEAAAATCFGGVIAPPAMLQAWTMAGLSGHGSRGSRGGVYDELLGLLDAEIFADLSTHERLTAAGTGTDHELWKALCAAGLPGAVAETGLLGLVSLAEEQGRRTAQVPLTAHAAFGILPLTAHGSAGQRERLLPGLLDGTSVATGAFAPGTAARGDGDTWRLYGTQAAVPWLRDAAHVLVRAGERCFLVTGGGRTDVETTAPWAAGRLVLDGTPGESLGPAAPVLAAARTAFAGLQAGVCAGALARAVEYTSVREQFGRPLSANQGVLLRAADAHMDTESIRVTTYEAAWRADSGLDAGPHALTAAWWASEAGKRVVHACQHLHGGIGADLDHPVHRHFLWGRQIDSYLGSGAQVLQELGALLAAQGGGRGGREGCEG